MLQTLGSPDEVELNREDVVSAAEFHRYHMTQSRQGSLFFLPGVANQYSGLLGDAKAALQYMTATICKALWFGKSYTPDYISYSDIYIINASRMNLI